MVLGNLIFQAEVVEQRFRAVVLPHHDQQASDDRNPTEHGRMLSSNMLLRNLILLIDVTFSTPTGVAIIILMMAGLLFYGYHIDRLTGRQKQQRRAERSKLRTPIVGAM